MHRLARIVHPVAGGLAMVVIAIFWLSTIAVELFGNVAAIVFVKRAIPWGLIVLIPALTAAGGAGFLLSEGRREGLVGAKARRMPMIAANGVLVLVPSAIFLAAKANGADLDSAFYAVQVVELIAGAGNLVLLGHSMRDGLKLTRRRRRAVHKTR